MSPSDVRRPVRHLAIGVGVGAVVIVAAFLALGVAQQRSQDDALTSATSAPPTTTSSGSHPTPSSATPTVIPTWPSDVDEVDLMTPTPDVAWAVWLGIWQDVGAAMPPRPFDAELVELGYDTAPIPVACFAGSVEQLGLDPMVEFWGWPLYFRTADEAQVFAELWSHPVEGITEGTMSCDWG